jgi:primase-polymerase (primpol)-like protein
MSAHVIKFPKRDPLALELVTKKDRWLIWRYERHGGKVKKVPYQARHPQRYASSTDPTTWGTYQEALNARPRQGGIGFVLGDGIGALDLDDCMTEEGEFHPWASEMVHEADSYTEVTPELGWRAYHRHHQRGIHSRKDQDV